MSLEEESKNTYAESDTTKEKQAISKWFLIALACILIITIVVVIVISTSNDAKTKSDGLSQTDKKENSIEELSTKYAIAVREYNEEVDNYDGLVSKIKNYDGFDADTFSFVSYHKASILPSITTEQDLSAEIQRIDNEKADIISGYPEIYAGVLGYVTEDYNKITELYNGMVQYVSVDFIDGLQDKIELRQVLSAADVENMTQEQFFDQVDKGLDDVQKVVSEYNVIIQIKQPSKQWIIDRLLSTKDIKEAEAVDYLNDPNGQLGKDGGYCDCIYFSLNGLDASQVPGNTVIEKGTDGGGAVEVYKKLEHAQKRCEYLSQFDDTLLYSGSYTLFGTMVIRTSYLLNDEEQVEIINEIIERFTALE